jgi:hypothetical protein
VVAPGDGTRIFFDASVIGAAKVMAATDPRITYPGHHAWPFDQDEADEIWLPHVGGHGWLTITRDRKMRYRTAERTALSQHLVRAVNIATKSNLNVQATVDLLQANWEAIEETLARPPAFYHLTTVGLRLVLNYS